MLWSDWPKKKKKTNYLIRVPCELEGFLNSAHISNTNFLVDVLSLVSDVCEVFDNFTVAVLHLQTLRLQMLTHIL